MNTRLCLINIGDELLKGRIVNTNASNAGLLLRKHGFSFSRVVVIADDAASIERAVREEMATHEVVIMSGGLGPTEDDITKQTLARLFETELEWDQATLDFLEKRYAERQRALTERTRRQAMLPANCEIIPNERGTAPGMGFEKDGKRLYSLPGVPYEMLNMLEKEIIPRIQQHYDMGFYDHRSLRLGMVAESQIAHRMEALQDEWPAGVSMAYLPRLDGLRLELSISQEKDRAQLDHCWQQIQTLFAAESYAEGEQSIPELLGESLRKSGLSLAIAESLTGGSMAAKVVSVSGASAYFKGSVTAYDVQVKIDVLGVNLETIEQDSVVSEAVACQMAEGVRKLLGADIGLATTGIAEKSATETARAWLAYADAEGCQTELVHFLHNRTVNIERASNTLLIQCLKNVNAYIEGESDFA
ncbi:MAG: CinA family nicotinamide mononucleotide deamidase-related protein [Bacteroidota bacterium]